MKTTYSSSLAIVATLITLLGCQHLPIPSASSSSKSTQKTTPPAFTSAPPASAETKNEDDAYRQVRLLTRSLMLIRHNYVDETKVSYSNLMSSALNGMLSSLDPYSQFMEPTAYRELKENIQDSFGGIGIQIGVKDNILTVIAPIEDTPAARAGLLSGDKIIEISGQRTSGLSLTDAVQKMRGKPGTPVTLKIFRGKETKEFSLVREVIHVARVKGTRFVTDGIGYIRITDFSEPTAEALLEAVRKLKTEQPIKALIVDLRNNPGGLLISAINCSELFLKEGTLVVSTRGRGDNPRQLPAYASGHTHFTDFPMAILVNSGSASAAEIMAGALQDNKRAVLVGEPTYGKGSVQNVIQLEDGYALRLTTAHYYTPSGRCIHEKGIEPDIVVPIAMEEWPDLLKKRAFIETPGLLPESEKPANLEQITDRQLDRAMDLLKGILIFQGRN
jgi:carboxyl-terminal processing protease